MRSLRGKDKITAEEIDFLKAKDCKIGLVIRDLTETIVSSRDGTVDALKAVESAQELGVPQNRGIALFVEFKPEWSLNHNWMFSFAHTVWANGYVPGFIGNTDSSKNFNFDRQCSHYVQETKEENYFDAVFCATEPKLKGTPTEWTPYCPSALQPDDMELWVCGTTTFDLIRVEDVYAVREEVLDNMWNGGEK